MHPARWWRTLVAVCLALASCAGTAAAQLVIAWEDVAASGSVVRAMGSRSPWSLRRSALRAGPDVVLAVDGRAQLVALSRAAGTLTVVDRRSGRVRRRVELPHPPEDVVVVSPCRAYVTRRDAGRLLRVDLCTGAVADGTDLSDFADADGNPDLGAMIADGGRLFIQVRRHNAEAPMFFSPPAMLAVLDLATEQLVDVDPHRPGVQAIVLAGTSPKHRMQIVAATRRLFVSASGGPADAGGLEAVDLDGLRSAGLVIREADGLVGADLGPFVFVTADRGYLTFSTDFDLSSHLTPFSLSGGVEPIELHVSVGYAVPSLVVDPLAGTLFLPTGGAVDAIGIHVFEAASGRRLTPVPLPTGGHATDLLLLRGRRGP